MHIYLQIEIHFYIILLLSKNIFITTVFRLFIFIQALFLPFRIHLKLIKCKNSMRLPCDSHNPSFIHSFLLHILILKILIYLLIILISVIIIVVVICNKIIRIIISSHIAHISHIHIHIIRRIRTHSCKIKWILR